MYVRLTLFIACFFSSQVFAANEVWIDVVGTSPGSEVRIVTLDPLRFITQIDQLVLAKGSSASSTITLPLPSGQSIQLFATEYSIMEQGAEAAGDFRSWKVTGIDDPATSGVIDMSSNGFHALLFLANGETVLIEPSQLNQGNQPRQKNHRYKSYLKGLGDGDVEEKAPFSCGAHSSKNPVALKKSSESAIMAQKRAKNIKNYRLAMAATGEFSQYFRDKGLDPHLAISTIVARVNAIYNRDLAINLQLVRDNSFIVFSDPDRDPYPENTDNDLLHVNTDVIDNILGSGAYDIGHVLTRFSTNIAGGVAILASVCVDDRENNIKGAGTTGSLRPDHSAFAIDFVAHEMGHQLGGTHTFNSITGSCGGGNRQAATAFEPGSGSSVMAYAGICGSNNIADHSILAFHIGSIEQINENIRSNRGSQCGTNIATFNEAPDISSLTTDLTVNAGEPFTLSGSAIDVDGDSLTFAWDQMDAGRIANKYVDLGDNALFAVSAPSESVQRDFEGLALTNRNLTFRFVVRDGKGGISSKKATVRVVNGTVPPPPDTTVGSGSGGKIDFLFILFLSTLLIMVKRETTFNRLRLSILGCD